MINYLILISFFYIIQYIDSKNVEIIILHQNNTGPVNRSRPVLICYPPIQNETFSKCFIAAGATTEEDLPVTFFNDVWKMNIDLTTNTVNWEQQPFENPPIESQGLFHQFWRKNSTAFSWTAGLNLFNFSEFDATCHGDRILTYDYLSQRFELTTPIGGSWGSICSGACGRYKDDIYCFSGFSCDTFTELPLWTKYNVNTNQYTVLNSQGLENLTPRDSSSVTCIEKEKRCLIGSGHLISGGTVDQWAYYSIKDDSFTFLEPENKPVSLEYLSPDIAQTWKIKKNLNFKVFKEDNILIIGGDNASGSLASSDTIRYLATFNRDQIKFKEWPAGSHFGIKQNYVRNVPTVKKNNGVEEEVDGAEEVDIEETDFCDYFIEYGGYEHNATIPLHYPNEVVLYRIC